MKSAHEERLDRKMARLEKWMAHLQNRMAVLQDEMILLKDVFPKTCSNKEKSSKKIKIEQLTFFGT